MAGSLTDAAEVDFLKLLTAQTTTMFATTPFANLYVALFTTSPSDSALGTEATGGGYARVDSKGKWSVPASGSVSNNATVTFTTFTGSVSAGAAFVAFGLLTHVTTLSAATLVAWGGLTDLTKTGNTGDTVSFASGALTITAD